MWDFATPSIFALANNFMLLVVVLLVSYGCFIFNQINTKMDIIKTALLARISMSEAELQEAIEHELNVQRIEH